MTLHFLCQVVVWIDYYVNGQDNNDNYNYNNCPTAIELLFSQYLPYNYLLFTDTREPLVEVAAQLLCITLDNNFINDQNSSTISKTLDEDTCSNLFINYLSRIHRDDVRFNHLQKKKVKQNKIFLGF